MFVHEQIEKQAEFCFQPNDAERRGIELDFLFEIRMRCMVGTQDRQCAVGDSLQQRIDICLRTQRRIHFVIRIKILDRFVGQRDVMRAGFAADFHTARPCFAQQSDTSGCTQVLAMNVMIAEFREQNIAHDNRFLT